MDYFVDIESVKVDIDSIQTKEDIDEAIKELENDALSNDMPIPEDIVAWYRDKLDDAPSESELSADVGDFSSDRYIGTKGEHTYTFFFSKDDTVNNYYINASRENWAVTSSHHSNSHSLANKSNITEEQACETALKTCDDLGLPPMKVLHSEDLYRNNADYESGDDFWDTEWCEGYYIVLSRDIGGVAADATLYHNACIDDPTDLYNRNYNQERVTMLIDDSGIISLDISGLLTDGTLKSEAVLLSFDKIQDVIRQEVSTDNTNDNTLFTSLSLRYVRIVNPENSNEFCFIPAWRLCTGYESDYFFSNSTDEVILINAIDGSVIDLNAAGLTEETPK